MAFSEQDHLAEAFLFDGADEAFRVGIQGRASWWQSDRLDAAALQNLPERAGVEWISIVNQVARVSQKAIKLVGQISCHLFHPLPVGLVVDSCDLHAARLQLDYEEHEVAPEPSQAQHFHGKEVGGREPFPVGLQERFPRETLAPLGSRFDSVVLQDSLHRIACDLDRAEALRDFSGKREQTRGVE